MKIVIFHHFPFENKTRLSACLLDLPYTRMGNFSLYFQQLNLVKIIMFSGSNDLKSFQNPCFLVMKIKTKNFVIMSRLITCVMEF